MVVTTMWVLEMKLNFGPQQEYQIFLTAILSLQSRTNCFYKRVSMTFHVNSFIQKI